MTGGKGRPVQAEDVWRALRPSHSVHVVACCNQSVSSGATFCTRRCFQYLWSLIRNCYTLLLTIRTSSLTHWAHLLAYFKKALPDYAGFSPELYKLSWALPPSCTSSLTCHFHKYCVPSMRLWMTQASPSSLLETQIIEATLTRGHQDVSRWNFVCEEQLREEQIVYFWFARREDWGIFC